jgi:hypothetical protein
MRALSYEGLSVYQWVQGYLSIAQMQDVETLRAMITHMQALFTEASFAGWDPAKFAYGCVLTDLEDGMYGWLDSERVAESRRRGIQLRQTELNQEQTSARRDPSPPPSRVTRNAKGGSSNHVGKKGGDKKSDKKTVRVCSYYNAQKCKFDSNHERGDIFWLHVCAKCRNPGHVDTDCSFLRK